ncbi:DUF2993 domain-containing protein [Synechococcus sp. PCC 7336]|uniref:LmeA family phospholipid-binding protein n=1 Tax=Synechococcus sp. PCC 7336 TaxID=195250 RepID=UPI000346A16A|nr:DUF2993 domain-containing protein [Synechococcus sp. PCC 7336]
MTAALFGGLTFDKQGGDRFVSKVVAAAISTLFQRTEKLEAQVRAEPVAKLLQGSVDGFDFIGRGLRMYNGLRIEAMELYLQSVAIDFGAIFQGRVKLKQPTQAVMRVVLTAEDLTKSFNTPFVVEKLQRLQIDGQQLSLRQTDVEITRDRELKLTTQVKLGDAAEWQPLSWTARLQVVEQHRIEFVDVKYEGAGELLDLGRALIEHVNEMLDLGNFDLDGTSVSIDRLRIQQEKLIFYGIAKIAHFPRKAGKTQS